MKDKCIFCRKELTIMQKKKLYCGNTSQTLCGECYRKYKKLSAVKRAEAALETGRATDAERLKEYLETVHQAHMEDEKERVQKRKKRISELKCMRCNDNMLNYGPLTFKLGEEKYFFSDINRLMSGSVTMNVYRCSTCGKVEFFVPDEEGLEGIIEGDGV